MKYRLSSLFLLVTIAVLLTPSIIRAVRDAQDGNPLYVRAFYIGLATGIVCFPVLNAFIGFWVSKRLKFESHVPGIALGLFTGFLCSFALMGLAAIWQQNPSFIKIPLVP